MMVQDWPLELGYDMLRQQGLRDIHLGEKNSTAFCYRDTVFFFNRYLKDHHGLIFYFRTA